MTHLVDFRPGQPNLMMAALRVGCAPVLDESRSISDAVRLARDCDAVVVVTGNNMDIEAEASDRPSLLLPGKTNELVEAILAVKPDAVIVNQSVSLQRASSELSFEGVGRRVPLDRKSLRRDAKLVWR